MNENEPQRFGDAAWEDASSRYDGERAGPPPAEVVARLDQIGEAVRNSGSAPADLRERILAAARPRASASPWLAVAAGIAASAALHFALAPTPAPTATPPGFDLLAGKAPALLVSDVLEHRLAHLVLEEPR